MSRKRAMFRTHRLVTFLTLIVGWTPACGGTGAPLEPPAETGYSPGELIVELAPGVTEPVAAQRLTEQGLTLVRKVADEPPLHLVRVPVGDESHWARELVRQGLIVWAERVKQ